MAMTVGNDDSVFASLQQVAGVRYNRAEHNRDILDTYVLRKARERGVRLPTGGPPDEYKYLGAWVFESTAGMNENVVYCDVGCFTDDHEVITPDGIKDVDEFEVGDSVYTLDPETFEVVEDEVAEVHEYPNIYGEVHTSTGKTHNFAVTENHNFYTANNPQCRNEELGPKDYEWNEYRDIPDARSVLPQANGVKCEDTKTFSLVDGVEEGYVTIYYDCSLRKLRGVYSDELRNQMETTSGGWSERRDEERPSKHRVSVETYQEYRDEIQEHADKCYLKPAKQSRETPLEFDIEDWLELVAWYVAEGSSTEKNPHRLTIAQEQENHQERIVNLCERMGLSYSISKGHVYLYGAVVQWLEQNCGVGSENKRLPTIALSQSQDLSQQLLTVLVAGDGSSKNPNSRYYWTISEELVEDVVQLAVRAGETPRVTERRDGEYRIQWGTDGSFDKRENDTIEHHDNVYCITGEENHLIPVGRNGNFHWIGQSMYPNLLVTLNLSLETVIGTREDLEASEYTEDDCVWGYIDPRPVKHLEKGESWQQYTDGEYKLVYDPHAPETKWTCDERNGPDYTKLYVLDHDTQKGFLTDCVDELIELKNKYRGDNLYGAIKRVCNSVYGVTGYANETSSFRLYDWRIAEAITLAGRKMVKQSADYVLEHAKEHGFDDAYVVMGDTDGYGISYPSASTRHEALTTAAEAVADLNNEVYDEMMNELFGVAPSNHRGAIEVEEYSPRVFIPSKNPPHGNEGVPKRYIKWSTWEQ